MMKVHIVHQGAIHIKQDSFWKGELNLCHRLKIKEVVFTMI